MWNKLIWSYRISLILVATESCGLCNMYHYSLLDKSSQILSTLEPCTFGTQKMKKKHSGKQISSKWGNTNLEKNLVLIVNNHIDLFKLYLIVFYHKIYTFTVYENLKSFFYKKKLQYLSIHQINRLFDYSSGIQSDAWRIIEVSLYF